MRQPSAAIQNFEKVLALQPQNKEAIKELTTLYYNYRRYDKAIAWPINVPVVKMLSVFWVCAIINRKIMQKQ